MSIQYANHPLQILESRLDWITATVKPGTRQGVVKGRIAAWIAAQESRGYKRTAFRTPFYEGVRTEGIAWGERTDDCLITLSGRQAAERGALVITWADTISRLDAQVTLQDPNLSADWATYVDEIAGLHPSVKSGETHTRLITARPHGVTSYIGSPSSDRMMRCYDKHAESDHQYPPGSWRFEVQWRHKRAQLAALRLLDQNVKPNAVLAAVCECYRQYGIDVPAQCLPAGWKDSAIATQTDTERRLAWLTRCIAPCVNDLIDGVGLERVMTALRLSSVIDTLAGLKADLDAAETVIRRDVWKNELLDQSEGSESECISESTSPITTAT
jgi:DNA relaxase NicK